MDRIQAALISPQQAYQWCVRMADHQAAADRWAPAALRVRPEKRSDPRTA